VSRHFNHFARSSLRIYAFSHVSFRCLIFATSSIVGFILFNCIPGLVSQSRPRTFWQPEAQTSILYNCDPIIRIPQLATWQSIFIFRHFFIKLISHAGHVTWRTAPARLGHFSIYQQIRDQKNYFTIAMCHIYKYKLNYCSAQNVFLFITSL
jgi:hypothetical protein